MLYYAIFLAGVNYADKIRMIGTTYSQGSNTEHSNSESIWIPNILMFCFRMVGPFENRTINHLKTEQNG